MRAEQRQGFGLQLEHTLLPISTVALCQVSDDCDETDERPVLIEGRCTCHMPEERGPISSPQREISGVALPRQKRLVESVRFGCAGASEDLATVLANDVARSPAEEALSGCIDVGDGAVGISRRDSFGNRIEKRCSKSCLSVGRGPNGDVVDESDRALILAPLVEQGGGRNSSEERRPVDPSEFLGELQSFATPYACRALW